MKHKVLSRVAGFAALSLFGASLWAGEPDAPPPPPNPAPAWLNPAAKALLLVHQAGPIGGISKGGVIGPQLDLRGQKVVGIENGPTHVLATAKAVPTPTGKDEFVNPKVEPGKVKWHADFDTACKAAAKSGKPVLLFQMMGKLDDQFC